MYTLLRTMMCAVAVPALASAQIVTIPLGTATTEGNSSTSYPWGRGDGGLLFQCIYDSSHFISQGLPTPILITGLRWRLDATQARMFTGGSYTSASVKLSTCPLDEAAASAVFAANRGSDLRTVFSGPLTMLPGNSTIPGPGPSVVAVTLPAPFYYNPSSGDLSVEIGLSATGFVGAAPTLDVKTLNPLVTRVFATTAGATVGTIENNHGLVMQLGYTPATGLNASFLADVTGGVSPLTVRFRDQSYSSAVGSPTSWAWDFDNDGTVDSTLQNPIHTFTACGTYDVRLVVTDGVNAPASQLRTAFIATDVVVPSFRTALVATNGTMQFTDTSTPAPTSWAWDFNGDGIVDSTVANPQWIFGSACGAPRPVTLGIQRQCQGPFTLTRDVVVANVLETERTGATILSGGCYMDIAVANPEGVSVCQVAMKTNANIGANVTVEVLLTPTSYAGATGNAGLWRQLGAAVATGVAGLDAFEVATFSPPLYLPAGSYGLYVRLVGANPIGTSLASAQSFATPDLSVQIGASGVLGATLTNNRGWNGALHYTTNSTNLDSGFSFFAAGCPGSLGIPSLTATSRPRLGFNASVVVDRLPLSSMFVLMGFNNVTSSLGPLPLSLAQFNMPGCSLHVSNDGALFLAGANNSATWNLGIPPSAGLLGLRYYLQMLALSPGTNAFGAVTSDAAVSIIGI